MNYPVRNIGLGSSLNSTLYPPTISLSPAGRGCANAQSTSNIRSETDQLGQDQGEGDETFREALTLTYNPVYFSLKNVAMEADYKPEVDTIFIFFAVKL